MNEIHGKEAQCFTLGRDMILTEIQRDFVDIGMQSSSLLLNAYFQKVDSSSDLTILDTASMVTDTAAAGVLLAGVLTAPPTLGASLGITGAIIILAKTASTVYEWYQSFSENSQEDHYPALVKRDIKQLRMQVQLHRALYLFVIRYRYVLHEVVDEKSLYQFSEQTAERLFKIMAATIQANPGDIPNAEDLLDGLLSSAKLSVTKKIDWVTIKHPRARAGFFTSNRIPTKLLWACAQWYVYDEENPDEYIGSVREHDFLSTTTLGECGVIAIRRDKLDLPILAANLKLTQSLTKTKRQETPQQLVTKLYFLYPVTRADVENYLECIQRTASPPMSLNQHLTALHGRTTIATCHDNALAGMNLRGGCFSGVDFHGADLSLCDIRDTDWSGRDTWLSNVLFHRVVLNEHTNFQAVHAEESIWTDVHFEKTFNLSLAKFNGALLLDCTVNANILLQVGTEWLLATFKNLTIIDRSLTLEHDFEVKLNEERQQRFRLQQEISRIIQTCDEQARSLNVLMRQGQTNQCILDGLKQTVADLKQEWLSEYNSRLNHILDRVELLERANLREEDAFALLHFRQTEDERWSDQHSADLNRDQRISSLEPNQMIVSRLWHNCKEINTTPHKQLKRMYVELKVRSILAGKDADLESLTECLDRHTNLDVEVILLHGETGCGKSFTLKLLFEELLKPLLVLMDQIFVSSSNPATTPPKEHLIPILLDFYRVQDDGHNSLRCGLESLFDKAHVDYLIQHGHCFIMIDNADMSYVPFQKLLQDCAELSDHFTYKPKIIFSVKTSYLFSLERDYRDIFLTSRLHLNAEYVIQPFDMHQVKRFFRFYHEERIYRKLYELQTGNFEIRSMIKSPLMLSIIAGAFFSPSFEGENVAFRSDFYEASWSALYEHVRHFLPHEYKNYLDFTGMIQRLAVSIFEYGKDWVPISFNRQPRPAEEADVFSCLYHAKIRYLSFLLITKTRVRFMHESLGHYWVAQHLLSLLYKENSLNTNRLRLWNLRNLNEFPNIQNFLIELIRKSPDRALLQQRLMDIVLLTKSTGSFFATAAANAITIRCRLNRNFNGMDLADIQIPDADLTEGLFVKTIFRRSLLKGVRFTRGSLLWSDMEEADLTNIQLLDATSFIQTRHPLKIFSVYPSLSETIIAYVVQPKHSFDSYHIRLISIQDGMAKKLKTWSAHVRSIYTMAWSVVHEHAILASAGEGGNIRLWKFGEDASIAKKMTFFARSKKPISVLVWGPNGQWLASGSIDGYVHIWEVDVQKNTNALIYSALLNAPVQALVWGKERGLLVALDSQNHLRIWETPEQPMPQNRLQHIILKDIFTDLKPVCSMALSWRDSQLALGLTNGNIMVMTLNGSSFKPVILYGHKQEVNSLCWAGPMLISSSADHTVRMWHHAKFSKILQHEHPVGRVEVLPSGRGLVSGVDRQSSRMYFWNIDLPHEERLTEDPLGMIMCLAARPEPAATSIDIAVGFVSGAVVLYTIETDTKRVTSTLLWQHEHVSVSQMAWSIDGRFLSSFCKDGAMVIKEVQNIASPLAMIRSRPNIEFQTVTWIKHHALATFFVVGLSDGSICFYDASQSHLDEMKTDYTLDLLYQIPSNAENFLGRLAVSSVDDQRGMMVAASRETCIEIYRVMLQANDDFNYDHVYSLVPQKTGVTELVWSEDTHYLAAVVGDQFIYVWHGQEKCLEYKIQTEIKCIKWQAQWLIVGCMNQMLIWDTRLPGVWTHKPICVPMGGSMFEAIASYLIVAEDKGICVFERDNLFAGQDAPSWFMQVKPDLLLHQVNISKAKVSPSVKELMIQKGAFDRTRKIFNLFSQSQEQPKLPKPSTLEELNRIMFRQFSSQSIVLCEDGSESSNASPGVRAASSGGSLKG